MPKVPDDQTPQFDTRNVPGVQFPYRQEFGKVGRAFGELGGAVENDAMEGQRIADEVSRQKAIADSDNAATNSKLWMDKTHRELMDSSPDGFVHDPSTADKDHPSGLVVYDGDKPRTIDQEFYDRANQHFQDTQESLSPMAQDMYRLKATPEIAARYSVIQHDQKTMQLKSIDQSNDLKNQNVFQEFSIAPWDSTYGVQERPDLNKFSKYAQDAQLAVQQQGGIVGKDGQIQPGLRNQQEIQAINTKQMQDYSRNWMESAITKMMDDKHSQGPHYSRDLQNLVDVVQGKDPQSQQFQQQGKPSIFNSLSEADREKYTRQLLAMVPTANNYDLGELKQHIEDYKAKAEMGGYSLGNSGASKQTILSWMEMARGQTTKEGKPLMSDSEIVKHVGEMTASEAIGSVGGAKFDLQPQKAQQQILAGAQSESLKTLQQTAQMHNFQYTDDTGSAVAKEVAEHGGKHINETEGAKKKDWAGFLAGETGRQTPSGLPEYRNSTAHAVENLDYSNPADLEKNKGIIQQGLRQSANYYHANYGSDTSYWRPLSKEAAAKLGDTLSNMSATQQAKAIDNLKNAYGRAFPNVMDTLINDNVLSNKVSSSFDWKFIGGVPTFQGKVAQLSAMQGAQQTKELYEAQFPTSKYETLRSKVASAWKDDIANIVKTSPLNGDQRAYAASVLNRATNAVAQMRLQSGGDVDEIIKNSKAEAFKGYPTIEKVGNHSDYLGGLFHFDTGPQVKAAFSPNLSEEQKDVVKHNLAKLMTEDGLRSAGVAAPEGTPFADQFHKMAAKNITSINYVNTKDGPGYTIDYQGMGKDGAPNGQINHLLDEHGNPKFFPESDLLIPRVGTPAPQKPLPKYKPGMTK